MPFGEQLKGSDERLGIGVILLGKQPKAHLGGVSLFVLGQFRAIQRIELGEASRAVICGKQPAGRFEVFAAIHHIRFLRHLAWWQNRQRVRRAPAAAGGIVGVS